MDIGHLVWTKYIDRFRQHIKGEGPSTTAKFPSREGSKHVFVSALFLVSPCPEPHLDLPGLERGPASSHDSEYSGGSGVGDRTPVHATGPSFHPVRGLVSYYRGGRVRNAFCILNGSLHMKKPGFVSCNKLRPS